MKAKILKTLLIFESAVIVLTLVWIFYELATCNNKTELLCEISPDGNYVLLIQEIGRHSLVFSGSIHAIDRIKVTLYENNSHFLHYGASFKADISTRSGSAKYEIEWLEDGVRIVLSGYKSEYYILPFRTLEDSEKHSQCNIHRSEHYCWKPVKEESFAETIQMSAQEDHFPDIHN